MLLQTLTLHFVFETHTFHPRHLFIGTQEHTKNYIICYNILA